MDGSQKRYLRLSNVVILILMGLSLFISLPVYFEEGWSFVSYLNIASFLFVSSFLLLNHLNFNKLVRVLCVIYPASVTMVATIGVKILYPSQVAPFDYSDGRVMLLAFSAIPFILFSVNERSYLFFTLGILGIYMFGFDPLHAFFKVGYDKFFGAYTREYIVNGIYFDAVMVFIVATVYYFVNHAERLLQQNAGLVEDLSAKNVELSSLFEELEKSNATLRENDKIIKKQHRELLNANKHLSLEVTDKSLELKKTNEELVKHNNELQQFSNTLSHNLRSPVANLLGLSQLFKLDDSDESRTHIAEHIHKSAQALDGVIKDLNKIVELRNNLFQIKEKIDIKKEVADIWTVLEQSAKQCNAQLIPRIHEPVTFAVRSYFHSMLYNLISNAIKYRHPDRDCLIELTTDKIDGNCIIKVKDNGMGVDLARHGHKMFGMYKRFHTHLEGKGLGLFLTKQQVESMGGTIRVESELGEGTTFIVSLPSMELSEIESQLFYRSKVANIYLDAINNITTLFWKQMPTPEEFKEVFTNNIEVFSSYKSEMWIVDLTLMVNIKQEHKQWILDNAIDQYVAVGIKKIVVVRNVVPEDEAFWHQFEVRTKDKSLKTSFAETVQQAKEILLSLN